MSKTFVQFILFFLFSPSVFTQTTYYVSSSSGSDNNNGTSEILAWQTIDNINNQNFSPGDQILFKKGDIWVNQRIEISGYSGTENNEIRFDSYPISGTEKPIFTNIIDHSHTWTNQGNNIWKADNPPLHHPERIWVNGIESLRGNSFTEVDGINFYWVYDAEEAGDLYFYSENNPSLLQFSYTSGGLDLYMEEASFFKFSNLDFQGGWTTIFLNCDVSNTEFENMTIGKNASLGININCGGASSINSIKISDCIFDANFTLDYSMAVSYFRSDARGCGDGILAQAVTNLEINNCTFTNWGHASINLDGYPDEGFEMKVSNVSIHDNFLTSSNICYGGRIAVDDAYHCEIFNNEIINTSVQTQFNGFENHFHHNIIFGTTDPPIIDNEIAITAGLSIESYSSAAIHNNIIENNVFANTEGAGFRITTSGSFDIHNNIIRNNIFFNCGSEGLENGIGIRVQEDTEDCATYDNVLKNNLIYNENTPSTVLFRGDEIDVTGLNEINGTTGYEVSNNISEDPIFLDFNNLLFEIEASSPCIDAGTETLATLDFTGIGIPQNGVPDIGIHELLASSVYENKDYKQLTIYPNPLQNFLNIEANLKTNNVWIINELGESLISSSSNRIDVSHLVSGLYIVQIETNEGCFFRKIIKE